MVLDLIIPGQQREIVFLVPILQNQYFYFPNSLFLTSLVFLMNALDPKGAQGGKIFGYSKEPVI